jgi:hypothetical protein
VPGGGGGGVRLPQQPPHDVRAEEAHGRDR